MNSNSKNILAVVVAGFWINASEFFRNEVLVRSYWLEHYRSLGMTFPSEPVNGMVWMVWGFLFALAIFVLSRKFSLVQTGLVSWLLGFVLMWLVTWNMGVLPPALLICAVPLSLLESFVAVYLCRALSHPGNRSTG